MKINKKGFTAVELILFIVVMGTLAYFGITKYRNMDNETKLSEATGIMHFAMANTDLYLIKNGTPKQNVLFTGYERTFDGMELPGNCASSANTCQTEFWEYESKCEKHNCTIILKNKGWLPGGDIVLTLDASDKNNPHKISKVGDGTPRVLNYLCPFLKSKKMYADSPNAIEACKALK